MNETKKMKQWIDGGWTLVEDPRESMSHLLIDVDYDKWMLSCNFHRMQEFGSVHGYGYTVFRHNDEACWIVGIHDPNDVEDVIVEGYTNLASLLSHLAPGAISVVNEDAMSYLERKENEERKKERGEIADLQAALAFVTDIVQRRREKLALFYKWHREQSL